MSKCGHAGPPRCRGHTTLTTYSSNAGEVGGNRFARPATIENPNTVAYATVKLLDWKTWDTKQASFWARKESQPSTHLHFSPFEMRLAHLQKGEHQGRARSPTGRHAGGPTASGGCRIHRGAFFAVSANSENAEPSNGEAAELHAARPKAGDNGRDSLGRYLVAAGKSQWRKRVRAAVNVNVGENVTTVSLSKRECEREVSLAPEASRLLNQPGGLAARLVSSQFGAGEDDVKPSIFSAPVVQQFVDKRANHRENSRTKKYVSLHKKTTEREIQTNTDTCQAHEEKVADPRHQHREEQKHRRQEHGVQQVSSATSSCKDFCTDKEKLSGQLAFEVES